MNYIDLQLTHKAFLLRNYNFIKCGYKLGLMGVLKSV
jgi:hypothetical protein